MKKTLLTLLMLCPFLVKAQAFQVNLQGQKQIAMGHTGTGLSMDGASLFFNPGAMAMLDSSSIIVGTNPIFSKTAYMAPAPTSYTATTSNPVGTPFHFYGVFGKKGGKLKAGLGVYTPFGSSVVWGDNWRGRYVLQSIALRSVFVQPTVSYKVTDKLSLGVGFVYAFGSVNLQQALPLPFGGDGKAELDGKASGLGFNAGVFFKATDKLSVGLSYRSGVKMKVEDGDAKFTTPAAFATAFPAENKFSATLPLPKVLTLGFGFTPVEKLTLALDINYTGWATYDTLAFDYEKDRTNTTGVQLPDTKSPREYKNSYTFRLGTQYMATEALSLRAGISYGLSPVKAGYLTPETPDSDRTAVSVGVGYKFGKVGIDASFLYVHGKERHDINLEKNFGGTYQSRGLIPGVSLSYTF